MPSIKKIIKYEKQQAEILDKIINILELDDENSTTLYELDTNKNKQNAIENLTNDIKKYFSVSFVKGIQNPNLLKRSWLSIIKQLLKKEYNIISSDYRISEQKIRTKRYFFMKKVIKNN